MICLENLYIVLVSCICTPYYIFYSQYMAQSPLMSYNYRYYEHYFIFINYNRGCGYGLYSVQVQVTGRFSTIWIEKHSNNIDKCYELKMSWRTLRRLPQSVLFKKYCCRPINLDVAGTFWMYSHLRDEVCLGAHKANWAPISFYFHFYGIHF